MKIRYQPKGLKSPVIIDDAQSVVVLDENSNPMYVAQQVTSSTCVHEKAGTRGFEDLLKQLGIGLTAVYKVIKR